MPSTRTAPAKLMQQVKGVSSQAARRLLGEGSFFQWQHGYGVFGVCQDALPKVMRYVAQQKVHHVQGDLVSEWEETDEEADL